jgi:hypothetical protein
MSTNAKAKQFTPVTNSPSFERIFGGEDRTSLPLDSQGLLRYIEFVAFPETYFKLVQKISRFIYQVETCEYPTAQPLYTDERFLEITDSLEQRKIAIPSIDHMINSLQSLEGTPYLWGGNYNRGVPELLVYYPPKQSIQDTSLLTTWTLKGVDCSGLLYQAAHGSTPRNTSELVHFGKSLLIEGLTLDQIIIKLLPLDLIVWKGHVIVVLDHLKVIESKESKGVIISSTRQRLGEVMYAQKKKPVNDWNTTSEVNNKFVIRRWHPDNLSLENFLG